MSGASRRPHRPARTGRSLRVILRGNSGDVPQDAIILSIIQPTISPPEFASCGTKQAESFVVGAAMPCLAMSGRSQRKYAHPPGGSLRMSAETVTLTDLWCGSREHRSPPHWDRQVTTCQSSPFRSNCYAKITACSTCPRAGRIGHSHGVGAMRSHLLCLRKPPFERNDPSVIVK